VSSRHPAIPHRFVIIFYFITVSTTAAATSSESPGDDCNLISRAVQRFDSIKHKSRIRAGKAESMSLEGDETAKQATVPSLQEEGAAASAATEEMPPEESQGELQGSLLQVQVVHPSNGENGHGSSQGASADDEAADHQLLPVQLFIGDQTAQDSFAENGVTMKAISSPANAISAADPEVADSLVMEGNEPAEGTMEAMSRNTIDPTIDVANADESPTEIDASSRSVDTPGAENVFESPAGTIVMDNANTELAIPGNSQSDPFGLIDTGRIEAADASSDRPVNRGDESPQEEEKKDASPVEAALDKSFVPTDEDVPSQKAVEIDSTKHEAGNLVAESSTAGSLGSAEPTDRPLCSDTNAEKRDSMDASGRCLVDFKPKEENSHTHDPPDSNPPSPQVPTRLTEIQETNEDESKLTPEVLQTNDDQDKAKQRPPLEPIQTMDVAIDVAIDMLPTPVFGATKRLSDAAARLVSEAGSDQLSQSHLPLDLLANKEKESFGLLARAESFRMHEAPTQQQIPLQHIDYTGSQESFGIIARASDSFRMHEAPIQQQMSQQHLDYSSSHHRAPQDPDAVHRRGESSVASLPRMNSGRGDIIDESIPRNMMLDDNSNRPFDDNSWRPSHVSYTHSPQGVHAPQAITMTTSGHYMMMQQPQGQPPHAFMPQPPSLLHHQSSFHSHQTQLLGQPAYGYAPAPAMQQPMLSHSAASRKRKIKLKLQEEILARPTHARKGSFFFGARSTRKLLTSQPLLEDQPQTNEVDRGVIAVSWYEGTSTTELQEHVKASALRKLKLENGQQLDDIRIMDTTVDPPEGT
jgi:hypothetical protein